MFCDQLPLLRHLIVFAPNKVLPEWQLKITSVPGETPFMTGVFCAPPVAIPLDSVVIEVQTAEFSHFNFFILAF